MTLKACHSVSSFGVSEPNRDGYNSKDVYIPEDISDMWEGLEPEIRAALIAKELSSAGMPMKKSDYSIASTPTAMSRSSSEVFEQQSAYGSSSNKSSEEETSVVKREKCPVSGATVTLTPLERAPKNVFSFSKTHQNKTETVEMNSNTTVTKTTKVVCTTRGWRNVFQLPICYDVNMVPQGTIFDPLNSQLLDVTGVHPEGYNQRFAVVDAEVEKLYGDKISGYFEGKGITLTKVVIDGGEPAKRPQAIDTILDALCAYKLRRREPFLAIGGGCVLDIAGTAACLYRRGVPFVRVPTTLLAIVDASVGVKNGVDYYCCVTDETYKNRVGSFYAPSACLLDPAFISSQDERNVTNGLGEIMKLALVRSSDLFDLLEAHGKTLVESKFENEDLKKNGVSSRIIDLSIQIMLEELGPNLWETKLDRCVDYGHTFSKLLEMVPGADIFHGEAVNVDGFFCVILSYLRGYVDMDTVDRIFKCMKTMNLPTNSDDLKLELAWQSCQDAIEHRHGEMRIPLITDIGDSICVNDLTKEELDRAIDMMGKFDH
mmetsp:Transcript_34839/g.79524  ORF Transcript_34839/g.79524 Transcript_34839/m.79524 type:complete len:544 (-) Transcript_34839:319-1950(-)